MTIETKYNIGDEVWAEFAGAPMLCKVMDITMVEDVQYVVVAYTISSIDERAFGTRFANELFPTKEELLKRCDMYKGVYSKNYRWGVSIEIFRISAKQVSKAYWNGIRWWKHDDNLLSIALIIHRFRLLVTFPIGRERGCCC